MHYYQHHIGDFLRATSQLPPHMMVGYLRLMWRYYETEEALPDDAPVLALKAGVSVDEVSLLLRAYFTLQDGVWHHSRCDSEIVAYRALREKNKNNGKRGGRPRKNPQETHSVSTGLPVGTHTEPTGNPEETLTNNHITNPPLPPQGGSAKSPRSTSGTRLPADWSPSEEDIAYCQSKRPELDPREVAEAFRDFWHSKAGAAARKTDWSLTWKTWVRNERTRVAPRITHTNKFSERQRVADEISALARGEHGTTIIDITPAAVALGRPAI